MRPVLRSVGQMLVMAAIVTSALLFPVGGLLALLFMALGISLQGFLTFGGALTLLEGLLAWWGLLLVPTLIYSAYVMPWHASDPSG